MAHKHLLFRSEARERVLRGATAIADAVRVTLVPKSRCVLIEKKYGMPIVCNDGVTIAKEFELKDPDENLGAQMLRGAAERTGEAVGDGTTTSTLLAHAIVAAQADFSAQPSCVLNRLRNQRLHGPIALVEDVGDDLGVAIDSECQLRKIV